MAAQQTTNCAEVIWTRPERNGRGPRPSHTREDITEVAIRVADAEGLEAVSMRRIAAELGTAATSLYRYVTRKDDLLELMIDRVIGERPLPSPTGDWQRDLRALARRSRSTMLRHPWVVSLLGGRTMLGPNNLATVDSMFGCLDGLGLEIVNTAVIVSTIEAFVRGHTSGEVVELEATRRTGMNLDQWLSSQRPYLDSIFESGRYPHFSRVIQRGRTNRPESGARSERKFSLGLDRLIQGISTDLKRISQESTC